MIRAWIIIWAKIPRTFFKSWTRSFLGCKEARSYHKLFQLKWVHERYIQTLHDMCSVMFRFCFLKYVLYINKSQDLHQKRCTFVKIWTFTPNQTIPVQLIVIWYHLRFLEQFAFPLEVREIGIPRYRKIQVSVWKTNIRFEFFSQKFSRCCCCIGENCRLLYVAFVRKHIGKLLCPRAMNML